MLNTTLTRSPECPICNHIETHKRHYKSSGKQADSKQTRRIDWWYLSQSTSNQQCDKESKEKRLEDKIKLGIIVGH